MDVLYLLVPLKCYKGTCYLLRRKANHTHMHTHTHAHREQPPVEHFEFDETLLQGYCSPKVDSGKVVINNLSHNPMKTRSATTAWHTNIWL